MGFGIVGLQKVQRGVGKYDAEAESSVGRILLAYPDPGLRQP